MNAAPTGRTPEQVREHYEIEKRLAARLRAAPAAERGRLYGTLYDELFRTVPHHPMLTARRSPEERHREVEAQLRLLAPYLRRAQTFLEIGPGDCAVSFAVASRVRDVWAVDISDEITRRGSAPSNFRLVLSEGANVPVGPGSIDVAYSNQLVEHLHPDDVTAHLRAVHTALAPGGVYVCLTPPRLSGPHDVSRGFDAVATGFHLREYTTRELAALCRTAGFTGVRAIVGARGFYATVPTAGVAALEALLEALPLGLRRRAAAMRILAVLLGVCVEARKDTLVRQPCRDSSAQLQVAT